MAFSYRELFFGRTKFCCCIPVRLGVIAMAILGIIFSAVLSIVLWYELSASPHVSSGVRAAFVIGGLVETFLFAASIFGLVGSIVRKLSFIRIYAIFTYVHFVLNLGVAIWFLVAASHAAKSTDAALCEGSGDAQEQCMGLISFGQRTLIVVASLVLLIEMYGALILTRYVNQLSNEKTYKRQTRRGIEEAFRLDAARVRYSTLASSHELAPLGPVGSYNDDNGTEYDPYQEASIQPPVVPVQAPRRFKTFVDNGRPSPPIEVGYGGGTWTHEEITEEEKARLKRELGAGGESPPIDDAETTRRRSIIKTVGGPTTPYTPEIEELPGYTYTAGERPSVELR